MIGPGFPLFPLSRKPTASSRALLYNLINRVPKVTECGVTGGNYAAHPLMVRYD